MVRELVVCREPRDSLSNSSCGSDAQGVRNICWGWDLGKESVCSLEYVRKADRCCLLINHHQTEIKELRQEWYEVAIFYTVLSANQVRMLKVFYWMPVIICRWDLEEDTESWPCYLLTKQQYKDWEKNGDDGGFESQVAICLMQYHVRYAVRGLAIPIW